MEREYRFRGKAKDGGEWEVSNTIDYEKWEAWSICEWTGLVDADGVEIYEHDEVVPLNYKGEKWSIMAGEVLFVDGGWYVRRKEFEKHIARMGVLMHRWYRLDKYGELDFDEGVPKHNRVAVYVVRNTLE